jgi:hypothetical protein
MHSHSEEFKNAAHKTGVEIIELSDKKTDEVLLSVYENFSEKGVYEYPLWENLVNWSGVDYRFSWEWFEEMLSEKSVYLFFEPLDKYQIFLIENGGRLPIVLEECYRFTFYVVDPESHFLFCYNDHDNLIASEGGRLILENYVLHKGLNLKVIRYGH